MKNSASMRAAFALAFALFPLFPSFIAFAPVTPPGVLLLPRAGAIAVLIGIAWAVVLAAVVYLRDPGPLPPTFWPGCAWIAATAVATALGFDPAAGAVYTGILMLAFGGHICILRFYPYPRIALTLFTAFLASGTAVSIAALAMVIFKVPSKLYTVGHGRAIGTFIVPGEFAGYLLLFVPTALGVALVSRNAGLRRLAYAGVTLGTIALAATFSRAGWFGFVAGGAFLIYMQRRSALRGYLIATVAAAAAAVFFIYNLHHNPSENFTRLSIWRTGVRVVERFPLLGVGPLGFWRIYPVLRPPEGEVAAFHAHSVLLATIAETGLVGLAAMLAFWGRTVVTARRLLVETSPPARTLGIAICAGLVATWAQGTLDVIQVVIFGMWLPFVAVALSALRYGLPEA